MRTIGCPRLTVLLLASLTILAPTASAEWAEQLATLQADPSRPEAEKARDANRLPKETLEFFRFREDMRVLELLPGGGWYTRLLAPLLAEDGKLYVAMGTTSVEEKLLGQPGFDFLPLREIVGANGD